MHGKLHPTNFHFGPFSSHARIYFACKIIIYFFEKVHKIPVCTWYEYLSLTAHLFMIQFFGLTIQKNVDSCLAGKKKIIKKHRNKKIRKLNLNLKFNSETAIPSLCTSFIVCELTKTNVHHRIICCKLANCNTWKIKRQK